MKYLLDTDHLSILQRTMDLRLACIALSRNLTVLTRNLRDFGRVPTWFGGGLVVSSDPQTQAVGSEC